MSRAWKFGENLNTDEIIPARFNQTIDPLELAKKVFCEVRMDFAPNVQPGDVVVADANFGCGSSREHAPVAILGAGVKCVIAASFARIFFRNAINIGLPILECPEAAASIADGDEVEVDLSKGRITNVTKNLTYQAIPLPDFVLKIAEAGGLVNFLKEHDLEELSE
ncbi:MAG: 3-isopropylmalate dehydratase small subunit [Anaerolineaceae bacterium]|nr:3-isopropylmalate dehydratase small subunit [Anaerolineaceae bacterium]